MQESPPPQSPRPSSKPPYLFLIPVALGLVGFIGYQTVRMGTDDTRVARSPYAIDTSVAQAVVNNGVITVHAAHQAPRSAQPQRVARVQPAGARATESPSSEPSTAPSASPSATPEATASASATPRETSIPKPKLHTRLVAKTPRAKAHRAEDFDDRVAQSEVPHISHALPARTVATINVGREQPSVQINSEATTPPITDAPSVRTGPASEAKSVQVAEAPHEAEAAPTTINAVDRIVEAKMVYAAAPEYPEIARDQGVRGTSVVFVTVDPAGSILHVSVASSSGNSTLDRSALSAARSSRYVPPKVDGKPAIETYRVTYDFAP